MNDLRLQKGTYISLSPCPYQKDRQACSCYRQAFFNHRMVGNNDFPGKYSKLNDIHVVQEILWRNISSFLRINIYVNVYPQETSSRLNAYIRPNFLFSSQRISLGKLLVTDRTQGKFPRKRFDYKWYETQSSFLKTYSHYFHRSQFTDNLDLFVLPWP